MLPPAAERKKTGRKKYLSLRAMHPVLFFLNENPVESVYSTGSVFGDKQIKNLGDVDTVVEEINEQRPEYENKSDGFLKIRRLNQSILIKSPTANSSFENWEQTGFTVTMWVRFLNTIGGGSLFTYGNPFLRNSSSFRLETLTKQAGDMMYSYGAGDFVYSRPKRIVRLVVWENVIEDHMLELSNNNEWVFSDSVSYTHLTLPTKA